MYEAQLLEQYLRHAVLAAADLSGTLFKNEERAVRTLSMGQLIRRLDAVVAVPPRFRDRLTAARTVRNRLAHHYFANCSGLLQTPNGRAVMIRELDVIADEFYQLWVVLDTAVASWLKRIQPTAADFGEDLDRAIG